MTLKSIRDWLGTRSAQLTASYLAVIMALSLAFSAVIYNLSANELARQVPPFRVFGVRRDLAGDLYDDFFRQRISHARADLLLRLILLNIFVLIVGGGLSYYLARRTLRPIERAMVSQSRFITDASHELRTPLTSILTSNEVALRNRRLTLKQAKGTIKSNIEDIGLLKNLAEGLLSLAQPGGRQVVIGPVAVQDAATEAINRVLPAAQAKNISLDDALPALELNAEALGLAQALVILLDNAIKYSPEGSTIYLEGKSKEGYGYISIRDEGEGIGSTDLPHIFDRFYRTDPSRHKDDKAGYGLGLSIAKQIVEDMGGWIEASSRLGHGSVFSLVIPLSKQS